MHDVPLACTSLGPAFVQDDKLVDLTPESGRSQRLLLSTTGVLDLTPEFMAQPLRTGINHGGHHVNSQFHIL